MKNLKDSQLVDLEFVKQKANEKSKNDINKLKKWSSEQLTKKDDQITHLNSRLKY